MAAMSAWWGAPLVVGHRGGRDRGAGSAWAAENTLAAFEQARLRGARAIELDVRTCAGPGIVVFHDETLSRMTHARDTRRVADVSEAELLAIDLGGATIPTLAGVLAWAARHAIAVNVEMKHDVPRRGALARATVAAVRASGADVLLSSFDPSLLAMAAALAPSIPRAYLTEAAQPRWANVLQEAARPSLVRALHLERTQVNADVVARYRRRGLRVGAWTVNDPAEAREFVRFGVASIITDEPGEMLRVLGA